jgi:hypothetical protein
LQSNDGESSTRSVRVADATTSKDGKAAALTIAKAYAAHANGVLTLTEILSGVAVLIAALIAFAASMSASKARAIVALALARPAAA